MRANSRVARIGQHLFFTMRDWCMGAAMRVETTERVIALTFDDGPNPLYTPQILDVLAHYQVKATFFMVGTNVRQYPQIVREVQEGGHAIANHTQSHPRLIGRSFAQVREELRLCDQALCEVERHHQSLRPVMSDRWFRPPYGAYDITAAVAAQSLNQRMAIWSCSGDDWKGDHGEIVANRLRAGIQPGAIVLLHDGWVTTDTAAIQDRSGTVDALRLILPELQAQKYRCVTLPEFTRLGKVIRKRL